MFTVIKKYENNQKYPDIFRFLKFQISHLLASIGLNFKFISEWIDDISNSDESPGMETRQHHDSQKVASQKLSIMHTALQVAMTIQGQSKHKIKTQHTYYHQLQNFRTSIEVTSSS